MAGQITLQPRRDGAHLRIQSDSLERFWQAETGIGRAEVMSSGRTMYPALASAHVARLPLNLAMAAAGARPTAEQDFVSDRQRRRATRMAAGLAPNGASLANHAALRLLGTEAGARCVIPWQGAPASSGRLHDWLRTASAMLRFVDGWQSTVPQVSRLRRIDRIGVELEGAWDGYDPRIPARELDAEVKTDGSVRSHGHYLSGGEVVSPPMSGLATVERFMDGLYPDVVDDSCGLHVHLSFSDPGDYALIMEPDFHGAMLSHLKRWGENRLRNPGHRFFGRLRGEASYCQPSALAGADDQLTGAIGRYTFINFAAWNTHSTVEIRLLPMFNRPGTGKAAVVDLIRFVEGYLRAQGSGKGALTASV